MHQYIERSTHVVRDEQLFWDNAIQFLYSSVREKAPALFDAMTSPRMSRVLGFLNYDSFVARPFSRARRFLKTSGINTDECVQPPEALNTLARIFARQIRYWDCRPLPERNDVVVSPADARVVCGSLCAAALLSIKGKFFDLVELLGHRLRQAERFLGGDVAVFRLTPDRYHYNHAPVSGLVVDHYEVDGVLHSCNPQAVVTTLTPFSKNRRAVTIIDTDQPGGTGVGRVAMVEVGALMIGEIVQCYSDYHYESPRAVVPGMWLKRGLPKSRYLPGGSTDVLIFEPGRVRFCDDLLANQKRADVHSRYSLGFGLPLVETDIQVRTIIATPVEKP